MKISSILIASAVAFAVAAPAYAAPLKSELEKIKKDENKVAEKIVAKPKLGVAAEKPKTLAEKAKLAEETKLAQEKKVATELKPKLGAPKLPKP
jgi:phage terminase Nu1 subunit (DNA packaging protein)